MFFSYFTAKASEIKINSIITLDKNIPKECGLNFFKKKKKFNLKVSIKKKKYGTTTSFYGNSNFKIKNSNILSNSTNIIELIGKKEFKKKEFSFDGKTDMNKTTMFFQELLISGGIIKINNLEYQIIGPIDSKVRLEYLFCTGEMFLPNYEKKNEKNYKKTN